MNGARDAVRRGLAAAAAAAERAACAPRTPPTLPSTARRVPATSAASRRPLRPLRAAERPPRPATSACCGGAATALRPAPTRQTGRGESWATRARGPGRPRRQRRRPAAQRPRTWPTRTHRWRFLRAARTSRDRARQGPEMSAAAARAAATTPGTRAIGTAPSAGSAAREEVPASAERAAAGVSSGRDGADRTRVRGLAAGTPSAPPKRWPPPPPVRRQRRRTRGRRKDRRSTAPTGWERLSSMGPRSWMGQSEGKVQAWREAKARTFSGSTRGLLRYSHRAATLPGRLTRQQELRIRSSRQRPSRRALQKNPKARDTRGSSPTLGLKIDAKLGRYRLVPLASRRAHRVAEVGG